MKYEDILAWWKNEKKDTKEDIYTLLDNFKILFAYHSGKIENETITLHDTREIFENGSVVNYTGDLRTLFEIKNQKDCFESLVEKIVAKQEITLELILELHRQLMKGCYDEARYLKGERPGEWKKHDYVTGDGVGAAPPVGAAEEAHRRPHRGVQGLQRGAGGGKGPLRAGGTAAADGGRI